jgi:hypothetical protein
VKGHEDEVGSRIVNSYNGIMFGKDSENHLTEPSEDDTKVLRLDDGDTEMEHEGNLPGVP